ncbi:hypothetical protein BGZ47_001539 [Haplosporangium gracile]|nr:hypothetical protein BGZ47_001539 [Haplosporangium gracile]
MTKQETLHDPPQLASTSTTSPPSHWSYISAVTLGLLSSSCCLIQLALNLMSVGCAGFSVLTTYRPLFLVFSSFLVLVTFYKYRWSSKTALTLALVLTLTTTPEMLAVYNQSSTGSLKRLPNTFLLATPSSILRLPTFLENVKWGVPTYLAALRDMKSDEPIAAAPVSVQPSSQDQAVGSSAVGSSGSGGMFIKYVVRIDGMACEACASRLRQHFSRQDGIERANVFFNEKKLVLWTQAGSISMMLSEQVIQDMVGLVDVKYTARLEDIFSFSSITP